MIEPRVARDAEKEKGGDTLPGMVIVDNRAGPTEDGPSPRIAAFIWGGKVRPGPTLPYGRWKGAA